MQDYQQRVIDEKTELDAKLERLTTFITGSSIYAALPEVEKDCLSRQHTAMTQYSGILAERIAGFPTKA